jgi:hypothetical protein
MTVSAKQSRATEQRLDCFVASLLAMTAACSFSPAGATCEGLPSAARGINRDPCGFGGSGAYPNRSGFVILAARPSFQPGAKGELVMAKGQMRSNKEKKKPKADKNLKKGGAAPSPFASGKTPAGQSPNSKK